MKKFFTTFLILAILAGVVFFVGWIQFRVPAGAYGVYVTKTHGWSPLVIEPGHFRWSWEILLPTNLRLLKFTLGPKTERISMEGELPSGSVYSKFAVGDPDFSYKLEYEITASILPESLPALAESRKIETQEALDAWLSTRVHDAGEALRGIVLTKASEPEWIPSLIQGDPKVTKDLVGRVGAAVPELNIHSISVRSIKVPDLDLYADSKAKYREFLASTNASIEKIMASEAVLRAQNELRLDSLERYGQLITKYPKLIDFLAVENKTDPALLDVLGKRSE